MSNSQMYRTKLLLCCFEVDVNTNRLQEVRAAIERGFIEYKHCNANMTMFKSSWHPADLHDWFRCIFLDTEKYIITRLVSSAGNCNQIFESEAFEMLAEHDDSEFRELMYDALRYRMREDQEK